jgi:V8-like Glu-specific endopeptidase
LDNGDRVWRIRLKSEGAYSLNFTFSRYLVPEGAELFVYTPDKSFKLGAFTYKNNKSYGTLAVAPLPGDEIIIEYYEPEDAEFKGELKIGTLGHDYLDIFKLKDGQFGVSGDCNIDINCPEGNDWQNVKRSVCRIVSNNSGLCTGTLVNNALQNQEPYILTASHCFEGNKTPENSVYFFNYESPSCNGVDGSVNQTISGSTLVAVKDKDLGYLDFALVKLSSNVPSTYKPYFAGWDSRGTVPNNTTCIHHPWGDVKKISQDFDVAESSTYVGYGYDPNSFWRVNNWNRGTTEGGSSGSSLFDENGRIVGTLTGGEASCNVDSCDYFQMFAVSYNKYNDASNQLQQWLDPANTGIAYLNGYDSYSAQSVGDLISIAHWEQGQNLAFYLCNEGGYLAGNNAYQDKAKAEFYNKTEFSNRNAISGAYVAFSYATGNNEALIELQVLKDNFGIPSTLLGSAFVRLKDIKAVADRDYVRYKFDPPVEVNSSIYLSVVLPQNEGDTVAIMTVEEAAKNTAWELNSNNEWIPYSNPDFSWDISLSHLIALEIGSFTSLNEESSQSDNVKLYPNPAFDELNVDLAVAKIKIESIQVFDTFGRLVLNEGDQHNLPKLSLNISDLNSGFYVLVIKTDDELISRKFIKK